MLGDDIFGNVTRLDNEIEKFPEYLTKCREKLETLKKQLESAKSEVKKEFPQEKELEEKTERLGELNVLLDLDKKDEVIMEDAPEENNT